MTDRRVIVYGVGAIGGVVAAALARAGFPVTGIARGAQLDAIRADGLLLRTPKEEVRIRFDCVADPAEIDLGPRDAILMTMKAQDTAPALDRLRAAGVEAQPVFCVQNAVVNERMALRRFPNVHGVTVMMPAGYTRAGEVTCFSLPRHGIFDIGRYPGGSDADDEWLAAALEASNVAAFVIPDVMRSKYGKLLLNLGNVVEAALGRGPQTGGFTEVLRREGRAVLQAAEIAWDDVGADDPRRKTLLNVQDVPGVARGSSSTQSLERGAGSIETDWLNGEIVLLAREHGVPAPANAWFQRLGARLAREGSRPGSVSVGEAEAGLAAVGVRIGG